MKVKASISVSEKLLKMIDALPDKPARSAVIEEALLLYFKDRKRVARDRSDLDLLNSRSDELNEEALDTLTYQSN
jgi:metal-responsive CopG/Arc/MetJ family transcriptional regulator